MSNGYWQQVSTGGIVDLAHLANSDTSFNEGDNGKAEFHLRASLPSGVVSSIQNQLTSRGVQLTGAITQRAGGSTILSIPWKQAMPLLPILAGILIAAAVVVALLVVWYVYKWISTAGSTTTAGISAALVIGGVILLVILFKKLKR
jgi:hypothetical protein